MNQQHIVPVDVRSIPRASRHGIIFDAFKRLNLHQAVELVSDHDPRPLRYLFDIRHPGEFGWDYVEQGPMAWRVRIERVNGACE